MDIGSKETETLLELLNELYDEPSDFRSLVKCLRHKGYSRSGAYRYANRLWAIRKIINDRSARNLGKNYVTLRGNETPSQVIQKIEVFNAMNLGTRILIDSGSGWKWHGRGAPILAEISKYMDNRSYSVDAKQQFIKEKLQELYDVLNICLKYEAENPSLLDPKV